jgi:hypothetical protein
MSGPRIITLQQLRTPALVLVLLVLIVAALNVPWSLTLMRSPTDVNQVPTTHATGEAAARPWPSRTPHDVPWPAPDYYSRGKAFGVRTYHVMASTRTPGTNGFSMQAQHLGWPLPVIERKQMMWDWGNASLNGPESDPRPLLMPLGLVVNPLIVGGAAWMVLVLPWLVLIVFRRAWRRRAGCCLECGYPIGVHDCCTECGAAVCVPRPPVAADLAM